jgi:hypothetical protein
MWGIYAGKIFALKIACANRQVGEVVGAGRETACVGNDPHRGHGYLCERVLPNRHPPSKWLRLFF